MTGRSLCPRGAVGKGEVSKANGIRLPGFQGYDVPAGRFIQIFCVGAGLRHSGGEKARHAICRGEDG
jgi:hypothetical protein